MERIESPNNAKIKLTASLHQRKNREKTHLFVAEGVRLVEMAASSAWKIEFAIVTDAALRAPRTADVVAALTDRGCAVYVTMEEIYKKVADTVTSQGILVVMERRTFTLDALPQEEGDTQALWVVLDSVQDPGNLGTILRTADATGASGVILLHGTADPFSDKVVRSAMGSLFHLPIVTDVRPEDFLSWAQRRALTMYATLLDDTAQTCFEVSYRRDLAVVFGNEGSGVSKALADAMNHLYIPMVGGAESLNVATASAVVLYEVMRQRCFQSVSSKQR